MFFFNLAEKGELIMNKKNLAVIYNCSCDDYAFCTATAIMSMEATNADLVDNYIIFCDRDALTLETRRLLLKLSNKILFRNFTEQEVLQNFLVLNQEFIKAGSYLVYAIVYIIDYLKSYRNVLFLGTDTITVSDISSLLSFTPIAWRKIGTPLVERVLENKEAISPTATIPLGDLFMLNEELKSFSSKDLINILNKYKYLDAPHEFAYAMFAYINNLHVNILDKTYFTELFNGAFKEPKIIHAHRYKFWKYNVASVLVPEWKQYYQKWLDIGGKPYTGETTGPANFPTEKHKILPYVFTLQEWADFHKAIFNELPIGIKPQMVPFDKVVPYYLYGKKTIRYYIRYKWKVWTEIGLHYKGNITDDIRTEMLSIKEQIDKLNKTFEYIEGNNTIHIFCRENIQLLGTTMLFLSFIKVTYDDIMESKIFK